MDISAVLPTLQTEIDAMRGGIHGMSPTEEESFATSDLYALLTDPDDMLTQEREGMDFEDPVSRFIFVVPQGREFAEIIFSDQRGSRYFYRTSKEELWTERKPAG